MVDPADVRDTFDRSVDLDPSQRVRFLDEACAQNAPLRREVERLLDAHDRAGTLFERLTVDDADVARPVQRVPEIVGAYRVIRELGRGGVGAVFLAVRNDDA